MREGLAAPGEPAEGIAPKPAARPSAWRLLLAGAVTLVLLPLNAQFVVHSELVYASGYPTTISLFYHAVFVLFVIAMLNIPLRRWAPKLAMGPAEMGIVYIGLCVASTLAAHDSVQVLGGIMSYAPRHAGPENNWGETILPLLPKWLIVSDKVSLRVLYEGGGSGHDPAVYRPWIAPGLWWWAFALAFHGGTFALVSLFRRRWIESERLTFPIVQLPLELMHGRGGFLKQPALWAALGVVLIVDGLNGLHTLYPGVPMIPTRGEATPAFDLGARITDPPWNAMGFTPIAFYPIIIGIGLLLPTELAFSCWFFFWFWRMQKVTTRWAGMEVVPQFPFIEYQALGGYAGITFFALWVSRRYVASVARAVLTSKSGTYGDPSHEAISHRTAVLLFGIAFAFLIWFSARAGMSVPYAVAFFAIYFIIAFSISRIRAEMGLPAHDLHFAGPCDVLPAVLGSRNLSPTTRAVSRMYFWFNRAYRNHQGPHHIEALRICEQTGLPPRAAGTVIAGASVIGAVLALWALLWCWSAYGSDAKMVHRGFGWETYNTLSSELTDPQPARLGALVAAIAGTAFMFVTLALKVGVPWWPLHPVGFAVSATWTMQYMWCPLLIAWIVKVLTTRYGGGAANRRLVPVAFGLILGDLIAGVFWAGYGIHIKKGIYSLFQ